MISCNTSTLKEREWSQTTDAWQNKSKNDKVENVATGESKIGEFGKVGKGQKLKSIVKDGVIIEQVGKVGKSKNSLTEKERKGHNEEKLCKSIIKGLARRNREKHAILAEIEEEQPVICIDDVTRKELPEHEVRKAREQELKYSRDLGVCVQVDEREATAQYQLTPVDTKWVDTDKAREGGPSKSDHEFFARVEKRRLTRSARRETPPLESLKAIISIAANHKETFSIMHIYVSRAYFHAKAQRPVVVRHQVDDRMVANAGEMSANPTMSPDNWTNANALGRCCVLARES